MKEGAGILGQNQLPYYAMQITPENLGKVLSAIGLKFLPDQIDYPAGDFTKYVATEYKNSERYQTDEVYRMFELTLLHHATGMRIVYTTHESYYGDSVEYKIIFLYIIRSDNKRLDVLDVDFDKQAFLTNSGTVTFQEVSKKRNSGGGK